MADEQRAAHVIRPLTPETYPGLAGARRRSTTACGAAATARTSTTTPRRPRGRDYGDPEFKLRLVEEGIAHAALVFDGDHAIAWCEYGSPEELPRIYHRKQYDAGEANPAPWRITCFFVDRDHRRSGVAREALEGALDLIAQAGRRRGRLVPQRASRPARGPRRRSSTTAHAPCSRRPASRSSGTSARARPSCARRSRPGSSPDGLPGQQDQRRMQRVSSGEG